MSKHLELYSDLTDTTFHATQGYHSITNFHPLLPKLTFLKSDLAFLVQAYGIDDYDKAKEIADRMIGELIGKPVEKENWNVFNHEGKLQTTLEVFAGANPLHLYASILLVKVEDILNEGYTCELA